MQFLFERRARDSCTCCGDKFEAGLDPEARVGLSTVSAAASPRFVGEISASRPRRSPRFVRGRSAGRYRRLKNAGGDRAAARGAKLRRDAEAAEARKAVLRRQRDRDCTFAPELCAATRRTAR